MHNQRLVATATDRMYNPENEALGAYEVREQDGVSVQRPARASAQSTDQTARVLLLKHNHYKSSNCSN
jgi:hypothetical protein